MSDTDPTGVSRWLMAGLLPLGPAAIAVLRFVLPYDTVDDSSTMARKFAAEQGSASAVLWLSLLAVLTLVPATYVVAQLIRTAAPRLTTTAILLLVPGYLVLPLAASSDATLWSAAAAGHDPAAAGRLIDGGHPSVVVAEVIFVIGHVLGTVLLGAAMWRSGVIPRWAAIATAVSQPIHFIAAVVVVSHTLDLIGWGLQAAGFAAVAWTLVRRAPAPALVPRPTG